MRMGSKTFALLMGMIVLLAGAVFLLGRTLTRPPVGAMLPPRGVGPGAPVPQGPAPSTQAELHPSLTAGLQAIREMRLEEAVRLLEEVPADHEAFLLAQYNLGVIQEARGNPGAAIQALQRVVSLQDESAEVYAAMGRAYSRAGDFDSAESATLRAIELDPGHVPARYLAGFVRIARGEIADAINAYRRALTLDTQSLHIGLARLDLVRLHGERPEHPATHYALAFMANATADPDTEMRELDHFFELDPQEPALSKARARQEALKAAVTPAAK